MMEVPTFSKSFESLSDMFQLIFATVKSIDMSRSQLILELPPFLPLSESELRLILRMMPSSEKPELIASFTCLVMGLLGLAIALFIGRGLGSILLLSSLTLAGVVGTIGSLSLARRAWIEWKEFVQAYMSAKHH